MDFIRLSQLIRMRWKSTRKTKKTKSKKKSRKTNSKKWKGYLNESSVYGNA